MCVHTLIDVSQRPLVSCLFATAFSASCDSNAVSALHEQIKNKNNNKKINSNKKVKWKSAPSASG